MVKFLLRKNQDCVSLISSNNNSHNSNNGIKAQPSDRVDHGSQSEMQNKG